MNTSPSSIRLTQYSHGAGCGCKISPKVLSHILDSTLNLPKDSHLIVGNDTRDDAAVYDLGDGTAIISTTDFFMPIVDDGFDFGRIAATNAISDVYAMAGQPIMAIAILGWPLDKLPPEAARAVMDGARFACAEAKIPLAGGHSIDSPEPIFGLAVTGKVTIDHIKKNSGGKPGDKLFLTKPLGVGILTTAQKKGYLKPEDTHIARDWMIQLNKIGELLGPLDFVHSITDVTGFGLLGHLTEMCLGSNLSAEITFDLVPRLPQIDYYLGKKAVPGGTHRNWESYGHHISPISMYQRYILSDPQTSGGLMIAVSPAKISEFQSFLDQYKLSLTPFGELTSPQEYLISVN